jgi:tetratricopeptide (TPR) repeat protein
MRYLTSISLALIVHVLLFIVVLMVLACTATPATLAPTPNIDATIEARFAQERGVEATVEAKANELVADQPTPTPTRTPTPIPTLTATPRPTPTPNASSYAAKGNVYFNDGKYQLAGYEYTKAIRLDPSYARAYYNRGLAYGALGQYSQNEADKFKACAMDNQYC